MFFLPAEYLCETTRTYECLPPPDHRLFHRRAVGAREILGLTWDEIDEAGGVIRLSPRALEDVGAANAIHQILEVAHPQPDVGLGLRQDPA